MNSLPLILFYFFTTAALLCALLVILVKNPVHAVLFLVLTFVLTAGIWMLLEAEFLSLILILVYVGAVMTLFLFVVMMMNLQHHSHHSFRRYLPWALVLGLALAGIMLVSMQASSMMGEHTVTATSESNIHAIGAVLYTDYLYAFELIAVILLVSIIAAISLAFRGRQQSTKAQKIEKQIATRRKDSIKLVRINLNRGGTE